MNERFRQNSGHDRTTVAARQEHDCLAAVAPQLSLLRRSLTAGASRDQRGRLVGGYVPPRRRRPTAGTERLTLPQWVSRTASVC
ncbi:hypothetical protein ACWER6_18435 [Streptomyces sp. NPDC004009]